MTNEYYFASVHLNLGEGEERRGGGGGGGGVDRQ